MRLSLKTIARFTHQMATYEESYVDIRKALSSLANSTHDMRLGPSLRRVVERITEGDSLLDAFSAEGDRYPQVFLRMTKVGEESGTLGKIYKSLGNYFDQQLSMRNRFVMKLIYPCFMIVVLTFVHAVLSGVHAGITEQGTNMSQIEAVAARTFFADWTIIAVIIAGIIAARYLLWGRSITDALVLYIPPLRGPFRKIMLARFSLSMYLMTGSAIKIPDALTESGKATGNAFVTSRMENVAEEVMQGSDLAPALAHTGLFPADFLDVVNTAEESGTLSESLQRVSTHYAESAERSMDRLVSGLAWFIYLAVAGIMAYYIISLYAGYVSNITNAINQAGG